MVSLSPWRAGLSSPSMLPSFLQSLPDCCQLDSWDPAGFHWVPPSTFVPPGDETGDEPQLRRSDLSQDKDPLDPQTAEAQGAANEAAGMGWRPTNRALRMVEAARWLLRVPSPDSGRPAPVLSLAPPPACLQPAKWPPARSSCPSCRVSNHQPRLATPRPHLPPCSSQQSFYNPICFARFNKLLVLKSSLFILRFNLLPALAFLHSWNPSIIETQAGTQGNSFEEQVEGTSAGCQRGKEETIF